MRLPSQEKKWLRLLFSQKWWAICFHSCESPLAIIGIMTTIFFSVGGKVMRWCYRSAGVILSVVWMDVFKKISDFNMGGLPCVYVVKAVFPKYGRSPTIIKYPRNLRKMASCLFCLFWVFFFLVMYCIYRMWRLSQTLEKMPLWREK